MMCIDVLADGLLWFGGSSILQIVKCGLKMRHNQVTMKCKILSQAQSQNSLLIYANTAPLKLRGVALAYVRGIWHCKFNTVKNP